MLSTSGIISNPSSIATAITTIFASVPKPGFCLSGIQKNKTTRETKKVAWPMFKFEFNDMPSDKTTQGELPREVTTRKASPIPNTVNPKIKRRNRCKI
jgi:hypothetical protein